MVIVCRGRYGSDSGPSPAGVWRLPPNGSCISDIPNQSATVNTATGAIPFVIDDPETSASNLVLTVTSSNPALVPTNNIVFGGFGSNRSLTITPTSNVMGLPHYVFVSDGELTSNDSFLLTVNPAPLTVSVDSKTRDYGQSNPVLTGTLTGVQAGDDITPATARARPLLVR